MDFDQEKLRKRFRDLTKKGEAIREKSDPVRSKRDKAAQRHAREIDKLNKAVRSAEKGLFEIDQERAMISRALGGKVGEPE